MKTLAMMGICAFVALNAGAAERTPRALRCAGTVVDGAGQPVAGAIVERCDAQELSPYAETEAVRQATTGADGKFELPFADGACVFLARKPGLAAGWLQWWAPTDDVLDAKLVLTVPGLLTGMVVDEGDKPVVGAVVSVAVAIAKSGDSEPFSFSGFISGRALRSCFNARTGNDGRFRIEGFPTNATAELAVGAPGKARRLDSGSLNYQELPFRAGQEDIRLVLEPAGSIEGRIVVEESGQPVPVARLSLVGANPLATVLDPVESGKDGRFRIADVPAGSFHLAAAFGTNTPPDWVAEGAAVTVESGQTAKDIELTATRGGMLQVRVLAQADQQPRAGVSVNAYREQFQSTAVTDARGMALLRLAPGDYQIMASQGQGGGGNVPASVEAGKTNQAEIEVVMPRKISGVVRRPDGKPAAGAALQIVAHSEKPTKLGEDGRFERSVPTGYSGRDMVPCLLVRDPERNLAVAMDLDEGATTFDLKLEPALTLVGRVECDGKPVTNATAALIFWTGNSGMHLSGLAVGTNTPGRFEIPALPPGRKYGLYVSAPGFGRKGVYDLGVSGETAGRKELETVELKSANLTLAGQILDADDKPVAGVSVNLNGDGQPNGQARTDREGRFHFDAVCEGPLQLYANSGNANGNVTAAGGDTNVVLRLGESSGNPGSGPENHRLKGVVTDPEGQPAARVELKVFPQFGMDARTRTGTNGSFSLNWTRQPWQTGSSMLVFRDTKRNLATAIELDEEVTNLNVRLKPGLVLTGRVEGTNGAALPKAEVGLWFKTGNNSSQFDPRMAPTDGEGRYRIDSLPVEGRYTVFAKAAGYGRQSREIGMDSETNRIEMESFVLKVANRVLSGRVTDENDKPVSGVNVSISGDDQPDGNVTTGRNGQFTFKVCEGQVRLYAYSQSSSSYGQATAEAGDTNVVLVLGRNSGVAEAPSRASLKNKPLPDLAALGFAPDAIPTGKPLLLCLFDFEQRSCRRSVRLLGEQVEMIKIKGVVVLGVQTAPTGDDAWKEWADASPLPFPVARINDKTDKTRWATQVESLPWLILTDGAHRVVAEGFALEELESKLPASGQ